MSEHFSKDTIYKFKNMLLEEEQLLAVAQHMASCEKCANAIANSFDKEELLEVPLGFEEEIKKKIKSKSERKREFIFYSARVAIAASIALVIVFSNVLNMLNDTLKLDSLNARTSSVINSVNNNIDSLSKKAMRMEEFNNAQKEK